MESTSRRVVGWVTTSQMMQTSSQLLKPSSQTHHASLLRFTRSRIRSFHAGCPTLALQSKPFVGNGSRRDGGDPPQRTRYSAGTARTTKQPWRSPNPSSDFMNRTPRQSWVKSSAETPTITTDKPTRAPFTPGSDPFTTANKLKKYLARPNLSAADLEAAESVIKGAPRPSVNVVSWNLLLAAFGKARLYTRMWKSYNDMKKTGIAPSSRTYSIMLSHYSRSRESSERTLGRATILFDQSQRYLTSLLGSEDGIDQTTPTDNPEITPAIANAYLGCLAHFGKVDEMERVYEMMGSMAHPDSWTYSVMFGALLANKETAGSEAMMLWNRLVRENKDNVDSFVAIAAMRCFMLGDKAIRQKGIDLLQPLYGLSLPGQSALATGTDLPRLTLDERVAETALKLCLSAGRTNVAVHISEQILEDQILASTLRLEALNAILSAFAAEGDIKRCLDLLATDREWNSNSYIQVLRAVVGKGDADAAEQVMTHAQKRGLDRSAQLLGLLMKTAINSGRISSMRKAWNTYQEKATSRTSRTAEGDNFWENKLRQDVVELTGKLLAAPRGARTGVEEAEEREMIIMREKLMKEVAPRRV